MKRVKLFLFLLPVVFLHFILPQKILAETKTFKVNKDTYANQAYPDNNYGSTGGVVISNKFTTRLGYLQFEEIKLPEGAILNQAILKFYVHELHYADRAKINVGPITSNWEENTLSWNNKPTINQTLATEAEISLTEAGWKEANLTSLVRRWLDGSTEQKGIFIYPLGFLYGTAETEYAFTFKTRESGDLAAKLEVEYHFEPSPSPMSTPATSPSPSPVSEESEEEPIITEEEVLPTPEESPLPEEKGKILGLLTPGQTLIISLIALALIGAIISFGTYARKTPKEKPPKKEKKEAETSE